MGERIILHSDLNSFYASVEILHNPELRGKAVAVCGNVENRHGIILAKSEPAKKAGVKTAMAVWEAQRLCPGLILVPPHYDRYLKYSKLARAIYGRFTDRVEPYGMDECWLDITGCRNGYADGKSAAEAIRETVKSELGLTVSIGVSYNKIFAKLGSDMRKPDKVTCISRENFKEKIWPLPASELLYVGRATTRKLALYGIHTIGDLAAADVQFLQRLLGVNGLVLSRYANGLDNSRVKNTGHEMPIKSVGRGITCSSDLVTSAEVRNVMLALAQDVARELRKNRMSARGVQVTIRNNGLAFNQYQKRVDIPTQSPRELVRCAHWIFDKNHDWEKGNVRAVTITAIDLISSDDPEQTSIFDNPEQRLRREHLEDAVESIRARYGKRSIYNASLMLVTKMPQNVQHEEIMPGMMYR